MNAQVAPAAAVDCRVSVTHEFDVARVIAAVTHLCRGQGYGEVFTAHVATAASELANNLWMYAVGGGEIRLRVLASEAGPGVELVSEDQGPGIADLDQALAEGFSTSGGMGCGLPGARRLMDEFTIASLPGQGTRVVARKWRPAAR
jgi:serine/threonine-protein kinase RsbT